MDMEGDRTAWVEARIAPLTPAHDRDGFSCGVEALDRYSRDLALAETKRGRDACFVAPTQDGAIVGYYPPPSLALSRLKVAFGKFLAGAIAIWLAGVLRFA